MQEEAEPGALAAPCRADAVHAVVPVAGADERQAVRAGGDALVDRPDAVLEERAVLGGHARLAVGLVRVGREQRRLEERHALVEDAGVAGRADVLRDHVRQPEQVVGAARCAGRGRSARATSAGRRLRRTAGRRRAADALARSSGRAQQQRHHVLQLIAEAEGAARLVVAGARPEPAAEVLIEQPAVHQHVERIVRRAHLDRRRASRSRTPRTCSQRGRGVVDRAVTRDQPRDVIASSVPWPSRNTMRRRSPGCRTICTCSAAQGSSPAPNCGSSVRWRRAAGRAQRPVAADERRGDRRSPSAASRWRARTRRAARTRRCRHCARGSSRVFAS